MTEIWPRAPSSPIEPAVAAAEEEDEEEDTCNYEAGALGVGRLEGRN